MKTLTFVDADANANANANANTNANADARGSTIALPEHCSGQLINGYKLNSNFINVY